MRRRTLLKKAATLLAIGVLVTGCSKGSVYPTSVSTEKITEKAAETEGSKEEPESAAGNKIGTPENPTKITIEIFDRGNVPEGKGTVTDNRWTKYVKEEALKAGFDLEWVACPRDQETEKLNAWMATGTAPDICFTYDSALFTSFAKQEGIWELDEYIEEYGPAIKENLDYLLPMVSYNGKVYGLTGQSAPGKSATLKIRQDWLDILGLEVPTNPDELYTVLKAFKERDPGQVGTENVVPFAIPAPGVVGNAGYYVDLMYAFGIRDDAGYHNGFPAMPSGNYDETTETFRAPVDMPEAKNFYRWMNMLYKEQLIPLEFAIDTTGERYMQYVASGVAGFVNCNSENINPLTVDSVPDVDWEPIDPLAAPDGSRRVSLPKTQGMRMYLMIPKSCDHPGEVVRYYNWLIESNMNDIIMNGFEGEHYNLVDGVKVPIDPDYNKKDIFNASDMNLTGFVNTDITPDDKLALQYPDERECRIVKKARQILADYGAEQWISLTSIERPVNAEKGAALKKHMYEGAAKVIVAKDFEAEYQNYVEGWKQLGGEEYDAEMAMAIKAVREAK